jgi:hypothetical protein
MLSSTTVPGDYCNSGDLAEGKDSEVQLPSLDRMINGPTLEVEIQNLLSSQRTKNIRKYV